jgi:hypothetical protein
MLITSPIPNFIGGISQQPPSIRNANEAQDILNAVPSPVEGLTKRPPLRYLAGIDDSGGSLYSIGSGESPFFHLIERDETERYILTILQNGTPIIYGLNGVRQTVNIASGASLGTTIAANRRAMTIGDVTFLANKTQTVAMTASTVSQTPTNYNRAGLVWIRQSNYNREHIVKLTSSATTSTFTHISRSVTITAEGSGGVNATHNNVLLEYASGPTKAQTYPYAQLVVAGGKVTSVKITADAVGWESEDISVVLSAPAGTAGSNFRVEIKSLNSGEVGTDHVAKALVDGTSQGYIGPVGGIAATSPYTSTTVNDSVIYLQASADFTAVVEDDFAGEGITFIRDEVQRFEDLPPTAPHGYTVKIAGTPESPFDDYYVKFEADDGVFSRGVWVETVKPGIKYELDTATMPLILIRQSDGTFMLKKADGTTPGSGVPVGADYSAYKWTNRLVGDDESNPIPTFVGDKINDLVYHQSRLGFCSGENLVLSEVSEFFNFFRTTVLDLLDSDPIDVASSNPRVGTITAAIPFNKDLILFTPSSQMVLRGTEVLTPKTISIVNVADFDNMSSTVRPIPTANSIFFAYKNGQYLGVRELVPNELLDGSYLANDLTNNVSTLIKLFPTAIATTTHDNIAMVVADGTMYGYRYFNTPQERLQSAWFRFNTPDSNTTGNSRILWAAFVESDLYVAVARFRTISTSWITLEVISMGAKPTESSIASSEWARHLDCRVRDAGNGVYNPTTGLTTFDLPKTMSYSAGETVVVNENGYILPDISGTAFNNSTQAVGTISVRGDWTGINAFIGMLYPMTFEMSPFHLKAPAGRGEAAMLNGRLQLKTLTLQYAETGYFRVETTIKNGDTYVYPFTGEVAGLAVIGDPNILTGTMRVPLYSKNDNVTVKIQNDSPLPCKILSGEVEAEYTDRATRFR